MKRALVATALLLSLAGCQLESTFGDARRAELEIHAVPETARVFVDDESAGSARVLAENPLRLVPGKHLVTLEAEGYFPHDLELDLPAGRTKLEVKLRPLPP